MVTEQVKIRLNLVGENNTDLLSDELIDLALEDAAQQQTSTDALSLRLYSCYIIASNWQSLGFVTRIDGTALIKPDPSHYLDLYDKRIKVINALAGNAVGGFFKQSLDKRYEYNDDGVLVPRLN